jgi:oligoribonuclease NrnB/cAMP/cGMP phosphodiesterase (DHH superfamily)
MRKASNFDMVLYHGNCADGMSSSWVFWREDVDDRLLYGKCLRDQAPPDVHNLRVVILDFCYSLEETIKMAEQAKKIVIIDHHETSKKLLGKVPKNVEMIIDTSKSGSQLAWDYMYGSLPPWFVNVIAAHDLWRWNEHPEYKYLSDVLYRRGYYSWPKLEELYADTMEHGEEYVIKKIIEQSKKKIQAAANNSDPEDDLVKRAIKNAKHNSFLTKYTSPSGKEYTVRLVTCDRKIRSEVGNSLCMDCDFAVVWQYDLLTNQWWCACRSRADGGVDLTKVVEEHGGGGHVSAASFVIYGDKGEDLQTYFTIIEVPPHREKDAIKYGK